MCYLMRTDGQSQNLGSLFHIRVAGGLSTSSYLCPQDPRPLHHPAVDRALQFCGPGGPPHVKLVIEWDQQTKECLFGNIQEEVVQDGESVRTQQQAYQQQYSCTLDECFQLYTKEEQLAPDDAWKCPHCKKLQQGMVKLNLWTLPNILIIHLKRFRQVGERRNKLSTLVRFPLSGLDMAPHVVKRNQGAKSLLTQWSSWKQPYPENHQVDFLYDLYAVCNHHGSMQGGHYTAYCRNSVDGQWYSYDDSNVESVLEEEVCTRGAYILFYQRRTFIPPWSASSSVKGSTSSTVSDHWLLRLNSDSKRGSLVSRESAHCTSLPESPDSPVFVDQMFKEEKGGFETRPFVRGIHGRSISMKAATGSKAKDLVAKTLPLRWSFGSKDRPQPIPGELVEYLESGRRPRCTNDSIVPLMTATTEAEDEVSAESCKHIQPIPVSASGRTNGNSCSSLANRPDNQNKQPSANEKLNTLRRSGKQKEDDSSQRKTSKKADQAGSAKSLLRAEETSQPREKRENANQRSSNGGFCSSSTSNPTINNSSTLRRSRGTLEKSGDHERKSQALGGGESRERIHEGSRHNEGKFSFFKGHFMKKDSKQHSESVKSRSVEIPNGSRTSLINGTNEGRANGLLGKRYKEEVIPGRISRSAVDIKRSQSSSNIQSRSDLTLRRTVSLQKNGAAPQQIRNVPVDRAAYGTLQRTKYSTASLGRKKVPESSF
ncbi:ubiquitin carboxyl-terminal hydrolase 43a [Latimeria chalumnae]|uniref:ubiquitin carboxyl-terminal hydrolase 43a n=1 Tax=Latimeria chalumnae TaxID=7897 RepID=UPI00313E7934